MGISEIPKIHDKNFLIPLSKGIKSALEFSLFKRFSIT